MPHALGRYAAAALRARPRTQSPMVSQLLFGEPVTVLLAEGDWCLVRCCDDDFEGYVRSDQLLTVNESVFRRQRDEPAFALDLFGTLLGERHGVPISFGARLPDFDGLRLRQGESIYSYSGQAVLAEDLRSEGELILRLARKWLYVPELSGGRTPAGIDAPSFVQLVTRLGNLKLARTAAAMSHHGRPVDFVVQCQPADLAFCDDSRGKINHVGLLLAGSRILHVHGCVRIDAIDHYGIFSYELGRYTHRLRIVKRLLPDVEQPYPLDEKRPALERVDPNQMGFF